MKLSITGREVVVKSVRFSLAAGEAQANIHKHTHSMARRTSTKELSSARALSALSDGATNSKRPEIFSARFQFFWPSVCVCMCWGRGSSLPQLLLFLLLSNTFHIRVMPFVSGGFFVVSTYLVSGCLLDASSSYY